MSDDKDPKITRDIAIPMGRNAAGHMLLTRIQGTEERPIRVMVGELRLLKDGVPIGGDVVKLTPCEGTNRLNVETVIEDPYKEHRAKGSITAYSFPSAKYQENWANIFGRKLDPSEVN